MKFVKNLINRIFRLYNKNGAAVYLYYDIKNDGFISLSGPPGLCDGIWEKRAPTPDHLMFMGEIYEPIIYNPISDELYIMDHYYSKCFILPEYHDYIGEL